MEIENVVDESDESVRAPNGDRQELADQRVPGLSVVDGKYAYVSVVTSDGVWRDLPGLPWRFEGLEPAYITAAPVLGQHNAAVYQDLLGLSDAEMSRLIDAQIIY